MNTRTTSPPASFLTRLHLAWLLIAAFLVPALGANTFKDTGLLEYARYDHSATLLPSGKVLVTGGYGGSSEPDISELFDPTTGIWTETGEPKTVGRLNHTATLLPNGKVLVAGGFNESFIASAELYDPATGVWTPTGSMATGRTSHTATLLPNGKVLVAGGRGIAGFTSLNSAEIYDPATGAWTATGSLAGHRYTHTAALLSDGKVLVAGGRFGLSGPVGSAEIYDPVAGSWTPTGNLITGRSDHTATLLPDGKVLVAGGLASSRLAAAELYNPANGTWTTTGSLATARSDHTSTLLPNGKVLVAAGGNQGAGVYLGSGEIYDPASGTWTGGGTLGTGRIYHTATLLPGGQVLIAGGLYSTGEESDSAELFDSASGTWSAAIPMGTARFFHTATLLADGRVLTAGGNQTNSELYDPGPMAWSTTGPFDILRSHHTSTLLDNGKVLLAGGTTFGVIASSISTANLYDPATGTVSATGSLAAARMDHSATLLQGGKVLVAGGFDNLGNVALNSAELYDPATGTWSVTSDIFGDPALLGRDNHSATLLPSGKVLIAGGFTTAGFALTSAQIYDPANRIWTTTGSLGSSRQKHTATLLPSGKVLVVGGSTSSGNGSVPFAELYDPATGIWSPAGTLGTSRYDHTATLLPNGKVLVAGGIGFGGGPGVVIVPASTELYDPATGRWTATGSLNAARFAHTATLLPDGKVLVSGGANGDGSPVGPELYDPGLGFPEASQPLISTATFDANARLVLTGTGFRGKGALESPAHHPVVQLRLLENEQCKYLSRDPATPLSATGFTSEPVAPFAGHTLVTVFVDGIPSAASFPGGTTLIPTRDTDGDGLNDAAEFQLSALGFDWSLSQPLLVSALAANAGAAGLYTPTQVQALHVGTPLIQRDSVSGLFKLTIGVSKAPDLMNFAPFPMTGPQTSINGDGKLEFEFPSPDNAAFFRLESN